MPFPSNITLEASDIERFPIEIIGRMTENGLEVATKIVIDKAPNGRVVANWERDMGERFLADDILLHLKGDPVAKLRAILNQPEDLPEIPKPKAPLPPPEHAIAGFIDETAHEAHKLHIEDLKGQVQGVWKVKLPKSLLEAAEAHKNEIQELIIDHLSRHSS